MKIERFVLGPLGTNCYLIENEETKELVIVDPASCPKNLREHIEQIGYTPRAILLTHGHFDHVMGIDKCVEAYQIPVYLHEEEISILASTELNLGSQFGLGYAFDKGIGVKDGERLQLAGMDIRVIHTPGHTAGGCCYYLERDNTLISGDTLFEQSIGRTDFPTGSMSVLVRSIREKLFCLPEDTKVYPGHGDETSIGIEKQCNPFLST